ncbi:MAG: glycoside hydrolase family 125 protein [Bacillota bacterium]|nr:glycoside hydrolase family 125 protein [Bacillota bacterium]
MKRHPETNALLTVPELVTEESPVYLTGNEYVSLPWINDEAAITSVNVLRLDHRGLLEFGNSDDKPLIAPLLEVDGKEIVLNRKIDLHYRLDWIPTFNIDDQSDWKLSGEIAAPPGFKGFYYKLCFENRGMEKTAIRIGWQGAWNQFSLITFMRKPLESRQNLFIDKWTNTIILEGSAGLPLSALALAAEPKAEMTVENPGNLFSISTSVIIEPGAKYDITLFASVNLEAAGAGTGNVDLRRHGQANLEKRTVNWLENRRVETNRPELDALLNRNMFFSYFFALGRTLDGEELVSVTSRSPRYYVSAAFWSRDALLWNFPAVLMTDRGTARELLLAVFKRHIRNAGEHAHYIDGTVLYPGFELDQLAAFIIALAHYLKKSEDYTILESNHIQQGLNMLSEKALEYFDPHSGLYSTFLDPSDDPVPFPYLTYNNALLQCAFSFLGRLQADDFWQNKGDFAVLALELQHSIYEHCMIKGPFGTMFAWAVDGEGRFFVYDNPPGSLQLLAHYGFCSLKDSELINTVRWIRSTDNEYFHRDSRFEEAGSLHSSNPWPMGACNDLLACNIGGVDFFKDIEMDNGFFCETVDPETGRVSTGAAFASAAGFLAYALANINENSFCRDNDKSNY